MTFPADNGSPPHGVPEGTLPDGRSLLERLDDGIASVNPDLWLCGCLIAVIVPWLSNLI